ncbi:MAG: hypothetical protein B7Z41_00835 [Rhizobiales bacterium 12-66-7]|nr:MAG: hypothetical protein B7Z41_00835 [Rhizobiales bacterium 12-66-7]
MDQMKEFLVSIGWDVDRASWAKWNNVLAAADVAAAKLTAAFTDAEERVKRFIGGTTFAFDDLNFSAQRLDASATGLQALAYALGQTGGSSSTEAVSGLAKRLRTLPSTEGIINLLGVRTREEGALRDTTSILLDVVDALAGTPYVQAVHTAAQLGISEEQYNHLSKYGAEIRAYQEEFKERARRLGVDPSAAATSATLLMSSVRGLAADLDLVLALIAGALAPALGPLLDKLSAWLEANQDKIVSFVGRLVDAVVSLVRDVESMVRGLAPIGEAVGDFVGGADGLETAAGVIAGGYLVSVALRMGRTVGLVLAAVVALTELLRVPGARASTPRDAAISPSATGGVWGRIKGIMGWGSESGAAGETGKPAQTEQKSVRELDRRGNYLPGGGAVDGESLPKDRNRFATGYSPQRGGHAVEGGYMSSTRGPDGKYIVRTVDDYIKGNAKYVTVAGNSRFYGNKYTIPELNLRINGKEYNLKNVPVVVHDTGSAFRNAPEGRFDIAIGRDLGVGRNGEANQDVSGARFMRGWAPKEPPQEAITKRNGDAYGYPVPKDGLKRGAALHSLDAPAIVATSDEMFGRMRQTTTIVVNGDVDPNQTAYEVARAQRGVNSAVVSRAQSMVA